MALFKMKCVTMKQNKNRDNLHNKIFSKLPIIWHDSLSLFKHNNSLNAASFRTVFTISKAAKEVTGSFAVKTERQRHKCYQKGIYLPYQESITFSIVTWWALFSLSWICSSITFNTSYQTRKLLKKTLVVACATHSILSLISAD